MGCDFPLPIDTIVPVEKSAASSSEVGGGITVKIVTFAGGTVCRSGAERIGKFSTKRLGIVGSRRFDRIFNLRKEDICEEIKRSYSTDDHPNINLASAVTVNVIVSV